MARLTTFGIGGRAAGVRVPSLSDITGGSGSLYGDRPKTQAEGFLLEEIDRSRAARDDPTNNPFYKYYAPRLEQNLAGQFASRGTYGSTLAPQAIQNSLAKMAADLYGSENTRLPSLISALGSLETTGMNMAAQENSLNRSTGGGSIFGGQPPQVPSFMDLLMMAQRDRERQMQRQVVPTTGLLTPEQRGRRQNPLAYMDMGSQVGGGGRVFSTF